MNTSPEKHFMFGYIRAKYFLIMLIITCIGIYLNCNAPGFLGGFVICSVFGLLLVTIGDNLPIVKTYLGGGGFVAIFGAAIMAYLEIFPAGTTKLLVNFVKGMDYIGWCVAGLICGSILTMDRNLLIKAGTRYFFPVVAGIITAFLFTGIVGQILGYGWRESVLFIALPIMGGGTSAGAVPTAQTYGTLLTKDSDFYLSLLMPAVVIGNALSVIASGILNSVGKKFPTTSGNGVLMKGFALDSSDAEDKTFNVEQLGLAFVITGIFFVAGKIFQKFVPTFHYYAWTIILCAICKISNIIPKDVQAALKLWNKFILKCGAGPAVYFAIGYVYTDLKVVFANFSVPYFVLTLTTVLGAIVGSWVIGKLVGFYPIESAITAGLCMSNMGGSGDIATLGAANRMELMPFSQISSRIGGAIIIVIASILPSIIGQGL